MAAQVWGPGMKVGNFDSVVAVGELPLFEEIFIIKEFPQGNLKFQFSSGINAYIFLTQADAAGIILAGKHGAIIKGGHGGANKGIGKGWTLPIIFKNKDSEKDEKQIETTDSVKEELGTLHETYWNLPVYFTNFPGSLRGNALPVHAKVKKEVVKYFLAPFKGAVGENIYPEYSIFFFENSRDFSSLSPAAQSVNSSFIYGKRKNIFFFP